MTSRDIFQAQDKGLLVFFHLIPIILLLSFYYLTLVALGDEYFSLDFPIIDSMYFWSSVFIFYAYLLWPSLLLVLILNLLKIKNHFLTAAIILALILYFGPFVFRRHPSGGGEINFLILRAYESISFLLYTGVFGASLYLNLRKFGKSEKSYLKTRNLKRMV